MINLINITLIILFAVGCSKKEYLDANPDASLIIPSSVSDYQAILDNVIQMNEGNGTVPGIAVTGADEYYLKSLTNVAEEVREFYKWEDGYNKLQIFDWNYSYRTIFNANVVLDGLKELKYNPATEKQTYDNVKGSALFFRSYSFFELAQIFCPFPANEMLDKEYGLLLRNTSDINEKLSRATVRETYNRIFADLEEALKLLPKTGKYKTRPSVASTYGLLSRIYLAINNYEKAKLYADSCLSLYDNILDYNNISQFPMPYQNEEVLFHSTIIYSTVTDILLNQENLRIDTNLVELYSPNDLRPKLCLGNAAVFGDDGKHYYYASYNGDGFFWGGIAVDEILLNRSECLARSGKKDDALADLNRLMMKRMDNSVLYTNITATNSEEALEIILRERKKELLFRGTRWGDIRRFNNLGANISLSRSADGHTYILPANDKRFTYLIPDQVISFYPGMPQNIR